MDSGKRRRKEKRSILATDKHRCQEEERENDINHGARGGHGER
jgi:hypothetical protein